MTENELVVLNDAIKHLENTVNFGQCSTRQEHIRNEKKLNTLRDFRKQRQEYFEEREGEAYPACEITSPNGVEYISSVVPDILTVATHLKDSGLLQKIGGLHALNAAVAKIYESMAGFEDDDQEFDARWKNYLESIGYKFKDIKFKVLA